MAKKSALAAFGGGVHHWWTSTIETTTQFPVNPGTEVEVTCSHPDAVKAGSSSITCITGAIFAFSEEPSCSLSGFDAKLHKT